MRRRTALLLTSIALPVLLLGGAAAGGALAGGGCHADAGSQAQPTEAQATTVKIDGCTFAPTVTRVAVGTDVRFINASQSFHDIVGRDHAWGTDELDVGQQFSHQFATAGLYPYSCSLHPGMAGVVVVGSPAVAVEDIVPVSASEPVPEPTSGGDSAVPLLAAGAAGLLAGAAIGLLGARMFTRREDVV